MEHVEDVHLARMPKKSFPDSERRSKEILDLVHFDLCVSRIVASLGEYHYYVAFIDDDPVDKKNAQKSKCSELIANRLMRSPRPRNSNAT